MRYFTQHFQNSLAPIGRVMLLLQLRDAIPSLKEGKKYSFIADCFTREPRTRIQFLLAWQLATVLRYFPKQTMHFGLKISSRAFVVL